jgi:Rhodanese-like domain
MRKAVVAAFLCLSFSASGAELPSLTVQQVSARLKERNFYVFDNNAFERFQKGHVPGAKWLNPYALKASDLPSDKSATLVFYCASEH